MVPSLKALASPRWPALRMRPSWNTEPVNTPEAASIRYLGDPGMASCSEEMPSPDPGVTAAGVGDQCPRGEAAWQTEPGQNGLKIRDNLLYMVFLVPYEHNCHKKLLHTW